MARLQPKHRHSSLMGTLTRYFLILTSSVLILNAGILTSVTIREQRKALRLAQQATAEKVSQKIPEYTQNLIDILSKSAALYRLADLEGADLKRALDDLLNNFREASYLTVYDLDKKPLASESQYWVTPAAYTNNQAKAQTDQFEALQGSPYISSVYIGVASGSNKNQPFAVISVPLKQADRIVGIVTAEVNLSYVWDLVLKTKLGDSGYVYVIDNTGNLIAYPDPYKVLIQIERDDLPSPLQKAIMGTKQILQQDYRGLDGKRVVGTAIPVDRLDWWVISELPSSEAYATLTNLVAVAIGLILVSLGLAFMIARYLSQKIVRPIQDLEQGAQRIGGGDLSHIIRVQTNDEIGALAQSFNSMADRLRGLVGGLEQTVEQRTSELATAMSKTQDTLAYLSAVINNIADGLLVTDLNGIITQFNPALPGLFDLGDTDLLGQDCRAIFGDGLADLATQARSNSSSVFSSEIELSMNRVGKAVATAIVKETTPHHPTAMANTAVANDVIGSVILIRDITADKEVDKMKTDFISTVSHELRTPLTSVLGFAKIIKKKLDDTIFPIIQTDEKKTLRVIRQVGDNLSIILSEGERLTTLINDVLDIAKMEAGKIDWKMELLTMEEVLERSLAATSALLTTKHLTIHRDVQPNLPQVMGDRDRLIQVVINLLSNAIKFTDDGTITCGIRVVDDHLKVSITDQGIGIAQDDLPKVFEKFKQVGDTLTDKPKGTGLGLPICKQIIEHHNGRIWAESTLGVGTTMSFTLPINPVRETETREIALDALISQLRNRLNPEMNSLDERKRVILVIDDDLSIRELLRQQLEAEGYIVHEAKDGRAGVAQVKEHPPDLIILDVMMPEMSGFDVAAILKNDPQTMDIPIIINSIVEDKARGYRLGVDRYLTKPADSEELLQEVNTLLSQGSSTKKVMIVDENVSTIKTLSEVLQTRGYSVEEVNTDQELLEKALSSKPDMIIVSAGFSEKHNVVKTLRFEKGLENVLFLLLADEKTHGSDKS